MDSKKKFLLAAALVTVMGGTLLTTTVSAQEANESSSPMESLVTKIATKFNLNETEVQAVFDEAHQEMQAKHQKRQTARLDELVASGEITAEQKALILAKQAELQTERQNQKETMQALSPEERKAKMEAERAELEAWAEANAINLKYLLFGGRKGHGPHGMVGEQLNDSATAEQP